MSKGSKPRPCNKKKFDEGFDRIFGSKKPATDFESPTESPLAKGLKRDYMRELLSDNEFLWEAIGRDAVETPAWVPLSRLQGEELEAAAAERRKFWDAEADKIATMIFHKDDAELGKYIRSLAESYTRLEVDCWLEENLELA